MHRTTVPERWGISALLSGALLLRLAVAWAPFEWQLRHVLTDDSFYYLTIARHAVEGAGFTFDGIAPTNGFHPFWMALILPILRTISDDVTVVHAVLTLGALLDVASVYLLYRICRSLTSTPFAAWTAAALYGCTPLLISNAGPMNGLETSCNVAAILLLLRLHFSSPGGADESSRDWILYGVVVGVTLLARTDNIVLVAFLYLGRLMARRGEGWRGLVGSGAVASLVVLPWAVWSWATVGTIMQTSGVSVGYFARRLFESLGWGAGEYAVQSVKNVVALLRYAPTAYAPIVTIPLLVVASAVSIAGRFGKMKGVLSSRPLSDRRRCRIFVLVASIVLFLLVQTLRMGYLRSWYYLSTLPAAMILFSFLIDDAFASLGGLLPRRVPVARWGVAIVLAVAVAVGFVGRLGERYGELEKYLAVRKLNAELPDGARIGAWNSGLYGYFFRRGTVVNLDGVANNLVYPHIRSRTVGRYCRSLGIEYLIDDHGTLRAWGPFWGENSADLLQRIEPIFIQTIPWRNDTIVAGRLLR